MRDAMPHSGDKNHASLKKTREALTGAALSTFSQAHRIELNSYMRVNEKNSQ
jgi:hypothetical protein